jgi:hypothetical protein
MRRFSQRDFDERRWRTGAIMGVTLTDRCPVGCAHCSVSALPDDPGPAKNPKLLNQLEELVSQPEVEVVIITGGEPLVHPRELEQVVALVGRHGKRSVLHTSGYWGGSRRGECGEVQRTLASLDAVVIGVDFYHRATIRDEALVAAFRAVRDAGAWLVVQTLVGDANHDHQGYALSLLGQAFGDSWETFAELVRQQPLPFGRGEAVGFSPLAGALGRCDLVRRPMYRFDGEVVACCNEEVLRGRGPTRLRRAIGSAGAVAALAELRDDPLVDMLHEVPTGVLLEIVQTVSGHRLPLMPASKCSACWRAAEILDRLDESARERARGLCQLVRRRGEAMSKGPAIPVG